MMYAEEKKRTESEAQSLLRQRLYRAGDAILLIVIAVAIALFGWGFFRLIEMLFHLKK